MAAITYTQYFKTTAVAPRRPKVLVLAGVDEDEEERNVEDALDDYAILDRVRTIPEMQSSLAQEEYDALFCTRGFYESDWNGALEEVREYHPEIPVIVLASGEDHLVWKEVLDSGAFDLLVLPSARTLVLAVTEQAAASHDARKAIASLQH